MASEEQVSRLAPLSPDRPRGLHLATEHSLSTSRGVVRDGLRRGAGFFGVKGTFPSCCAFCSPPTVNYSVRALCRRHIRIRTLSRLLLRGLNSAFNELAQYLGCTVGGRHDVLREFRDAGSEVLRQGQTGAGRQQLTHAPDHIRLWCTESPENAPLPQSNLPPHPFLPRYITWCNNLPFGPAKLSDIQRHASTTRSA